MEKLWAKTPVGNWLIAIAKRQDWLTASDFFEFPCPNPTATKTKTYLKSWVDGRTLAAAAGRQPYIFVMCVTRIGWVKNPKVTTSQLSGQVAGLHSVQNTSKLANTNTEKEKFVWFGFGLESWSWSWFCTFCFYQIIIMITMQYHTWIWTTTSYTSSITHIQKSIPRHITLNWFRNYQVCGPMVRAYGALRELLHACCRYSMRALPWIGFNQSLGWLSTPRFPPSICSWQETLPAILRFVVAAGSCEKNGKGSPSWASSRYCGTPMQLRCSCKLNWVIAQ